MENTNELKTLEVKWSAGTVFQVPVSKGDTGSLSILKKDDSHP